ncbi:MAG TPA: hypothetical protein VFA33_07615 [Bryobacteraceae bacterium]|nr:hypothetical protein [Bryobacteraceae bacterium]
MKKLLLSLVLCLALGQAQTCTEPTPACAFSNIVTSTEAWAAQRNAAAVADYESQWPGYVQAVQIAQSRGGQNLPAALVPRLTLHVLPTSVADMQANKPAVQIVYGNTPTDYVCPPHSLPVPQPQTGGIGVRQGDGPWFSALPGDSVPDGTVIQGTSKDGVTGSFQKVVIPFGGLYLKVG